MKGILSVCILLSSFYISEAQALSLDGISWPVTRVFTESTSTGGFYLHDPSLCLFGIAYINLSSPAGRVQMVQLLTAKALGQKIVRLDYVKEASNACSVTGLHTN